MNDKDAYSVNEFCLRHGISRATLYNLWTIGEGPRRMIVGGRVMISRESADAWRRQRETAAERSHNAGR